MKKINVLAVDYWDGMGPSDFFGKEYLEEEYEFIVSDKPDFLFYSCFGTNFQKYDKCIRIFYTGENIRPNFNQCDYAIGFDRLQFGDRYMRKPMRVNKPILKQNIDYAGRKFCNFIYSNNWCGEGAKLRIEFCKFLAQYKPIDCPGTVLNNMQDVIEPRFGEWCGSKIRFIGNYKFTIAWENSFYPGYITEKLSHPLSALSIPIYMGDPDVELDFNPDSFINCNSFKNWEECRDYIIYLDTHDDAYLSMLKAPALKSTYSVPDIKAFLINIIENGRHFNKDRQIIDFLLPVEKRRNEILKMIFDKIIAPNTNYVGEKPEKFLERLLFGSRSLYCDAVVGDINNIISKIAIDADFGNKLKKFREALIKKD